jgi:hypothetical protein
MLFSSVLFIGFCVSGKSQSLLVEQKYACGSQAQGQSQDNCLCGQIQINVDVIHHIGGDIAGHVDKDSGLKGAGSLIGIDQKQGYKESVGALEAVSVIDGKYSSAHYQGGLGIIDPLKAVIQDTPEHQLLRKWRNEAENYDTYGK